MLYLCSLPMKYNPARHSFECSESDFTPEPPELHTLVISGCFWAFNLEIVIKATGKQCRHVQSERSFSSARVCYGSRGGAGAGNEKDPAQLWAISTLLPTRYKNAHSHTVLVIFQNIQEPHKAQNPSSDGKGACSDVMGAASIRGEPRDI